MYDVKLNPVFYRLNLYNTFSVKDQKGKSKKQTSKAKSALSEEVESESDVDRFDIKLLSVSCKCNT